MERATNDELWDFLEFNWGSGCWDISPDFYVWNEGFFACIQCLPSLDGLEWLPLAP